MAKKLFPWIEEEIESEKEESSKKQHIEIEKNRKQKVIDFACKNAAAIFLFFVIIIIVSGRKEPKKRYKSSSKTAVMISMLPISKGDKIRAEILKVAYFSKKDLTRTQKINSLKSQDAIELSEHMYAKKDIAPHKPIFWSDIKYQKNPPSKAQKRKIYFRK